MAKIKKELLLQLCKQTGELQKYISKIRFIKTFTYFKNSFTLLMKITIKFDLDLFIQLI